jgi:hypothetical protein
LIRRHFAGFRVTKQINRETSAFQTGKSQLSIVSISSHNADIPRAVMLIFKKSGDLG